MPRTIEARLKLLDAAVAVIRAKGYAATTVDDLCAAAGVTKGAFFHHFETKEALAVAAARHWNETTGALFAAAPYHAPADPAARVLAYLDFRRALLARSVPEFTCLLGTMVQEAYATHPAIRDACAAGIAAHAETLVADIRAAKARAAPDASWTPESLALFTQAALQGAFVLAKAAGGAETAAACVDHLKRYVAELLKPRARRAPGPRRAPRPTRSGRTSTREKRP